MVNTSAMMKPGEFIETLYLGDRACKAMIIDGWNRSIRLVVDCISRIRDPAGEWNFYSDEDIRDGAIVFEDVQFFELHNEGRMPNDRINDISVIAEGEGYASVEISINSVEETGESFATSLRLKCKAIHIEDPTRPGEEIRT